MIDVLKLVAWVLASSFKSRARLEVEILVLRHQLMILRRQAPSRLRLGVVDRLIFVWLYRLRPSLVSAITIVRPETVVRWHRNGFRLYWHWKSRSMGGRPPISRELRRLILRDEPCQSPVGRTAHPWRAAEARRRRSHSRRWPSILRGALARHARAGRRSCATTPLTSPRWICSSYRRSASASTMGS